MEYRNRNRNRNRNTWFAYLTLLVAALFSVGATSKTSLSALPCDSENLVALRPGFGLEKLQVPTSTPLVSVVSPVVFRSSDLFRPHDLPRSPQLGLLASDLSTPHGLAPPTQLS